MAISNRTRPEFTTDKNGKVTTVHRLAEQNPSKANSRLSALGHRQTRQTNGEEKTSVSYSVTETATLLRETLKDTFSKDYPGVKFSARTDKYSGGASINISYTDGPPASDVVAATELYATKQTGYDGAEYKTAPRNENGEDVLYGANYVFVRRHVSDEAADSARKELIDILGFTPKHDGTYVDTPASVRDMYETSTGGYQDATVNELVHVIASYRADVKNK